jgi:hypothetical protein
MERAIGDAGEYFNDSVATRAVNIDPDMTKVRQLDIYHHRYQQLFRWLGAIGLGLLLAGIALCFWHHPVWGGLVIVLSLPVLYLASRLPQTLQGDAYKNGLLIPGIITNLAPLTILCVADVRTSGDDEPDEATGILWGAKQVVIKELTVQPACLGEQIPCVSLFGGTSPDGMVYVAFEPRPLAWGTDNATIIEQARRAIDDEEWLLLPTLAAAYTSAEKNDEDIAYFDSQLRPVVLPKASDTQKEA